MTSSIRRATPEIQLDQRKEWLRAGSKRTRATSHPLPCGVIEPARASTNM
ncbi:MAG: hypothetical protein AVDCRST_MAG87-1658 [uncultured Thermomicrobiales bacterium]|uniref:Uncharacterized protein n=1 Tax=uncultured Thermomicrobiales bacterium TaxID=1645740 RepID=A0A6J4UXJ7_9BACT|nr:MAG: hypothetical protein AVDCRST_MAG87-1658 [uncultured Thermomicrobiales bacterium]